MRAQGRRHIVMRGSTKNWLKERIAWVLVVLMSINTLAAVVGDNDGAAFITKAEFDSMKNDFQSQLDRYNSSLDNKIDGAIASYLSGIRIARKQELQLLYGAGKTLGLFENVKARPYIEGIVGGDIVFNSWAASARWWYNGAVSFDGPGTKATPSGYASVCMHKLTNSSSPFSYAVVTPCSDVTKTLFNLNGYCEVIDSLSCAKFIRLQADLTERGYYAIGLCGGYNPIRFNIRDDIKTKSEEFMYLCEMKNDLDFRRGVVSNPPRHNPYKFEWKDLTLSSSVKKTYPIIYTTNLSAGTSFKGVRDLYWHGANLTSDSTELHTRGELNTFGWSVPSPGAAGNFHFKLAFGNFSFYNCGQGAVMRNIQGDPNYGDPGMQEPSKYHGQLPNTNNYFNLFKADLGSSCTSNNLFSSNLADAVLSFVPDKCLSEVFNDVSIQVAPLYLGIPIVDVDVDDIVELDFDLLDSATYDIGFCVGGFNNQPVDQSDFTDSGCKVDGSSNHIGHFTGPISSQRVKITAYKKGLLFMKYGATGGDAQYIQLPNVCVKTSK